MVAESGIEKATLIKRRSFLVTGAFGFLFTGILFGWSIIKVPLRDEMGFSPQQLALAYTLATCLFCVGNILTGLLHKRLGVKKLLMLSSVLVFVGFAGCSGVQPGQQFRLLLFYGLLVGCGIGLSYNGILSTVNSWFPDKKGTCSGILMMCFGLSSIMWGKLSQFLFSHPAIGWRRAYLIFGLAIASVLILCALHLRVSTEENKLPKAKKAVRGGENFEVRDLKGSEVLQRPSFWIYYIYGICAAAVGATVLSFAMDVCLTLGAAASVAVSMVGIASAGNGLGRVMCGLSYDILGRRRTFFIANCITLMAPVFMLAALSTNSLLLAAISLLLSGLSFGTCPTIGSTLMSSFYGMKYFPINYSLSNSKMIFSSMGASAASWLLSLSGGYFAPYIMLLILAITAFIMSFFIRSP